MSQYHEFFFATFDNNQHTQNYHW